MGKKQIIVIGVTGGMGCGKSHLCKTFNEEFDIPVFYCDVEVKKTLNSDSFVISEVKRMFGDDIYVDNKIDSAGLAKIIFNDEKYRIKMEMLTRGPLLRKFYDFVYLHHDLEIAPFVLIESAIMIETGFFKLMDEIIYVNADYEDRIKRLVNDRGVSEEETGRRIKLQKSFIDAISSLQKNNIKNTIFCNDFSKKRVNSFVHSFYSTLLKSTKQS